MGFIRKFFRNIVVFFVAGLFSFAILFLIKNPDFLQASVLNVGEISIIKLNKRDIAYKQSENLLDIFFNESITQNPVTIVLSHNPSISLEGANLSGQCESKITNIKQGATIITINCLNFDSNKSIVMIPFAGQKKDILIEEAYIQNNNKTYLSIGNISETNQHN